MDARDARVVLVTTPDVDSARAIARTLVEERHAACGSIVPGIASIYRWQGEIEEASEALLILKTSDAHVAGLSARVAELHPYDVPEVLALGVDAGHAPYVAWLAECLRAPGGGRDGA